jgi:hypothetical protein
MSTNILKRSRCAKCVAIAVVKYVNIPEVAVAYDGTHLTPTDWTHIIDCPNCGIREQYIPAKRNRVITSHERR